MFKPSLLLIALPFVAMPALADKHDHEHKESHAEKAPIRQHDAHVHGLATLNLVKDGQDFLIEIEAAGADILGFEHEPKTDEEKAKYQQGLVLLNQPENLFVFAESAGCKAAEAHIKDDINHKDEHGHDEHDHDDHAHDDHEEHAHEDHDEHGHDDHEGHDHDDHGSHGAFVIEYQFTCSDSSKVTSIETNWFKTFPSTEVVESNILVDEHAEHQKLTAKSSTIRW